MPQGFEWDPAKNTANVAKHGIGFEGAARIFEGPVLEQIDTRRDYGEERMIAFGEVDGNELAIVYTMRQGRRRLVSARRAHSRERKAYREVYPRLEPSR